jgi:hypothetical protein
MLILALALIVQSLHLWLTVLIYRRLDRLLP